MTNNRKEFGKRGAAETRRTNVSRSSAPVPTLTIGSPTLNDPAAGQDFSISQIGDLVFKSLFDFQGRIGRLGYWCFGIAYWVLLIALTSAFGIRFFHAATGQVHEISKATDPATFYSYIFIAGVLGVMRISLEVRRFHDRGISGFWYFGYFIPFFGLYLVFANSFFSGTRSSSQYGS